MTGVSTPTSEMTVSPPGQTMMARAFVALRIFTGLVWLTHALAKVTGTSGYDWGFISFNLVTRGIAKSIATDAASKTSIASLGAFYRDVVITQLGILRGLPDGRRARHRTRARLLGRHPTGRPGGLLLIGPFTLCSCTPTSTCGNIRRTTSSRSSCWLLCRPVEWLAWTSDSLHAFTIGGPSERRRTGLG